MGEVRGSVSIWSRPRAALDLRGSAWIPGQDPVPCPPWHWASVRPGQRPRSGRVPVAEACAPSAGDLRAPSRLFVEQGGRLPGRLLVTRAAVLAEAVTRSFRDRSASLQSGHTSRRCQGLLFLLNRKVLRDRWARSYSSLPDVQFKPAFCSSGRAPQHWECHSGPRRVLAAVTASGRGSRHPAKPKLIPMSSAPSPQQLSLLDSGWSQWVPLPAASRASAPARTVSRGGSRRGRASSGRWWASREGC